MVIVFSRTEQVRHVALMGEMINVNRVLVRKPKEKRQLGRPRCSWRIILK
jgi:hypothetical protein